RVRTNGSRIVIGVDWNGQAIGAHIAVSEVVGTGDGEVKYIFLEKCIIKGGDFTQHDAVQKIIELNSKYDPDFIYVDHGYGEMQIEMLHKYGKDNPRSGLHKKVKAYAMQSQIEILDPKTKAKIKKSAKPFMVNVAVMQLEQHRLILPISEDTTVFSDTIDNTDSEGNQGLVQQMRNFQIIRYSSNGLPTYSQGDDHTLTAWMLSMVGFMLEFSDLTRNVQYVPVRFVGQPGSAKDEPEDHRLVQFAEITRQLDKGTDIPKYNNVSSISKAISDGEKLEKAMQSEQKHVIQKYFHKSRISRNSNLGKPNPSHRTGRIKGNRRSF
ncbi:MAG: hypothetical protein ACXABY_16890, partial [Candidatus Thorarchaeota archaeon]